MPVFQLSDEATRVILECASDCNVTVRNDYSGRNMYGDTCFGLIGRQDDVEYALAEALHGLGEEGNDELLELYRNHQRCTDSIGDDIIVYFNNAELDPEEFENFDQNGDDEDEDGDEDD